MGEEQPPQMGVGSRGGKGLGPSRDWGRGRQREAASQWKTPALPPPLSQIQYNKLRQRRPEKTPEGSRMG